ncbi:hypothetical protein GH714_030358 [Hevea brasiliensis]|uniref:WAT1-related protein n=1 Tax=Hevea brasiliensis TaxID=3981 RepID=A0A6A6LF20_HEVBR|nr:hypothetical protein GH714_030358 [Hevea brasiliensis]
MRAVAPAAAQRGGDGEDDVMLEHFIEELPSAFTGHIISKEINWGPVNYGPLRLYQEEMAQRTQYQVDDPARFDLFCRGIKLTSPSLATAMPNLAPGLIFLIAWTARLEKVKLSCLYSKVKIVDKQKMIGCLYLMAAVFVLSSNVVLQASTLGDFPAPMSLCAITSLIGVVITAIVQWFQDPNFGITWPFMKLGDLVGYSLLAGGVGGACVSFNGWAMKKRGPVLVSMFSPIGTVISVVLSVITLGESIGVGSLAGMLLMFTGLYFVLWAKGKEGYIDGESL